MQVRIGCLLYGEAISIYKKIETTLPNDVKLIYSDGVFKETVNFIKELENSNAVDVFISSGSNAQLAKSSTSLPVVEILPSGFDILLALNKAVKSESCNGVGVLSYQKNIPYLSSVIDILPVPIIERIFNNIEDAKQVLENLAQMNIKHIIGGTFVCDIANAMGMQGYNIISLDSIKNGIERAIEVARARKIEMKKAKQWHTILEFAHEGIVATDDKGLITVFNQSAEKVTGVIKDKAIGKPASSVLQNSRLEKILKTKKSEINKIQDLNTTKIITNRVPIIVEEEVVGSVATFQTIDEIRRAEHTIRHKLYDSGFVARNSFEDMIGKSEVFHKAQKKAMKYAKSSSSILIKGESGTGKEIFAQSIHNASNRKREPFVSVNCAALSPSLLESELFGYEEGAFTGAKHGGKFGLFELAHQGTIFLDEIAEIPLEIQARLLRVLEERQIMRLGGEKVINIDIRVITATNKDLLRMIENGTFREDLYYRINVLTINLPPLRERTEDIPIFFEFFMKMFREDLSMGEIHSISRHPALSRYSWPGNIRQLRNLAERFANIYEKGDDINLLLKEEHLPVNDEDIIYDEIEIQDILKILNSFNGNKSKTAEYLGISRSTLWRKLNDV